MTFEQDTDRALRSIGQSALTSSRSGRRVVEASVVDDWCREFASTRDPALRESIVRTHQWLVLVCARRMIRRRQPLDDLLQVGNIGLLKAIDRFDPTFGVSFHTFASATIIGELRRHYRTVWQLRVPRSLQERHLAVNAAVDLLTARLRRSPTYDELAEHLHLDVEAVVEAFAVGAALWSGPVRHAAGDDEAVQDLDELVSDDHGVERAQARMETADMLASLPPVQREALFLTYFEELRQSEIGERLGMSQAQVSRIIRRAVTTLRQHAGLDAELSSRTAG